jgi:hypothetical protein
MLPEALACTNVPIVYDNSHVLRGIFVNNICGALQWVGTCLLTCSRVHDDPGKSAQALIFPPGSLFVLIDRPNGKA